MVLPHAFRQLTNYLIRNQNCKQQLSHFGDQWHKTLIQKLQAGA